MNLLHASGDAFLCVFKIEGGVPLWAGFYLDSAEFLVFELQKHDEFDWVTVHLLEGELYLGNQLNLFIGVIVLKGNNFIDIF
jgi:hypothetical protein